MFEVHGVTFSAHTRKVLLVAYEKRIDLKLVHTIPLRPPAGFRELSPLGKIPVLKTESAAIPDSSVICQYLERLQPEPALYPRAPDAFARALWLEEFVDGGVAPHVLGGLLLQRVFVRPFFGREPDEALIRRSIEEELPPRFSYLESCVQGDYLVGDSFGIADITLTSILLNYHYAGEQLDAARHPRLHRYFHTQLRRPSLQRALATELTDAEQIAGLDLRVVREAVRAR